MVEREERLKQLAAQRAEAQQRLAEIREQRETTDPETIERREFEVTEELKRINFERRRLLTTDIPTTTVQKEAQAIVRTPEQRPITRAERLEAEPQPEFLEEIIPAQRVQFGRQATQLEREVQPGDSARFFTGGFGADIEAPVTPREIGFLTISEREFQQGVPLTPFTVVGERGLRGVIEQQEEAQQIQRLINLPRPSQGDVQPITSFKIAQAQIDSAIGVIRERDILIKQVQADPEAFRGIEGFEITKTPTGERFVLTPKFFETQLDLTGIQKRAETRADLLFAQAPFRKRAKSLLFESAIGLGQLGVGVAEFSIGLQTQLGGQIIQPDAEAQKVFGIAIGVKRKKFEFGGEFGRIRETPIGVPGRIVQIGAVLPTVVGGVVGGIKLVKAIGVKGAAIESVSAFAAFKIKPGVFTTKLTPGTQLEAIVTKQKIGDITTRKIFATGVEQDIKVFSTQIIKGGRGRQITTVATPATEFRIGTGFTEFQRVQQFKSVVLGVTGKPSLRLGVRDIALRELTGAGGFGGRTLTGRTADILIQTTPRGEDILGIRGTITPRPTDLILSKAAGVGREVAPGTTRFVSGRAETQFRTRVEPDLIVFEPSGKVRVPRITLRGIEFDLSKVGQGFTVRDVPSAPIGKGVQRQVLDKGLQQALSGISVTIQAPKPFVDIVRIQPKIFPTIVGGAGAQSIFQPSRIFGTRGGFLVDIGDLGRIEAGVGGRISPPILTPLTTEILIVRGRQRDIQIPGLSLDTQTRQIERTGVELIQPVAVIPRQTQRFRQLLGSRTRQIQRQVQVQQQITEQAFTFGGFGFRGGGFGGFLFPIPPRVSLLEFGKERRIPTRTFKRTPSFGITFEDLLGIQPAQFRPGLEFTGLVSRPRRKKKAIETPSTFLSGVRRIKIL